eukprot:gene37088-45754_t
MKSMKIQIEDLQARVKELTSENEKLSGKGHTMSLQLHNLKLQLLAHKALAEDDTTVSTSEKRKRDHSEEKLSEPRPVRQQTDSSRVSPSSKALKTVAFSDSRSSSIDDAQSSDNKQEHRATHSSRPLSSTPVEKEIVHCDNGDKYVGFLNSQRQYHGHGRLTRSDGTVYEGQFFEGVIHGIGVATYSRNSSFSGTFRNDKWHVGKFIDSDGSSFDGEWRDRMKHGKETQQRLEDAEKRIADMLKAEEDRKAEEQHAVTAMNVIASDYSAPHTTQDREDFSANEAKPRHYVNHKRSNGGNTSPTASHRSVQYIQPLGTIRWNQSTQSYSQDDDDDRDRSPTKRHRREETTEDKFDGFISSVTRLREGHGQLTNNK